VTYLVKLTVDPLPPWAVGTFDGGVYGGRGATALPDDGDGRAGSPLPAVGTASLSIAANGKISGKLLEGGRTWALSASEFSRVERVDRVDGSDEFHAVAI